MTCAHCGSRVPADALKCPACGSPQGVEGKAPPRKGLPVVALGVPLALLLLVGAGAAVVAAASFVVVGGRSAGPALGGFEDVRARGAFVVAADPHAPPFLSGTEGSYEGFEYALMAALADAAGARLEVRPTPYDDLLDAVARGEVDAAVGQLPPSSHPGVAYTRSYLQYNLCLTVRDDSPARGLPDLRGRTIGMYDDPTAEEAVSAVLGKAWTERTYGDYGYFRDLAEGRIDAVVYDCPLTRHELKGAPAGLRVADARLGVATYSVAVAAGREALQADVDRVLGELGGNGLLQQLAARWLGETPAEDAPAARIAVVRPGDTLEQVAKRALGQEARARDLLEWNRDILGSDPRAVYPGMQLRIR